MATQLLLFDVEKRTREFWEMSRASVGDAAAILIELLRESEAEALQRLLPVSAVSFYDIVKRKLGITSNSIPETLARTFADQADAVQEERLRIKEVVEEGGEFMLTVVDAFSRPATRGGAPYGFVTRLSAAGAADTLAQVEMTTAKFTAIARRQQLAGLITESQFDRVLVGVKDVADTLALREAN